MIFAIFLVSVFVLEEILRRDELAQKKLQLKKTPENKLLPVDSPHDPADVRILAQAIRHQTPNAVSPSPSPAQADADESLAGSLKEVSRR